MKRGRKEGSFPVVPHRVMELLAEINGEEFAPAPEPSVAPPSFNGRWLTGIEGVVGVKLDRETTREDRFGFKYYTLEVEEDPRPVKVQVSRRRYDLVNKIEYLKRERRLTDKQFEAKRMRDGTIYTHAGLSEQEFKEDVEGQLADIRTYRARRLRPTS